MAQEKLHLLTPLGRLVRGSLTERAKTDYDGNAYEDGKGPFEIGFAVPKTDPNIGPWLVKMYTHAAAGYAARPDIVARMKSEFESGFALGTFRFKVRDGDKPNQEGRINENTVGHWVFNLSTHVPIKSTYVTNYGLPKFKNAQGVDIEPNTEIPNTLIKIGDYAHLNIGMSINDKLDHTTGMFMNPNAVILAANGPAITGGLDIASAVQGLDQMIGALPAGATVAATPGLPATPAVNAAPAVASTGLPAPASVPATTTPGLPTVSPTNVAPHETFLQGPGGAVASTPGVGMPALP